MSELFRNGLTFGGLTVPLGALYGPVRDALAPSVAEDPCEILDDVMSAIESGEAQAWLITDDGIKGVVVTKVVGGNQCFVWHCAGKDIREWLCFLTVIEGWAKSIGCTSMELIGRRGWKKLLGWEEQAVVLRKYL